MGHGLLEFTISKFLGHGFLAFIMNQNLDHGLQHLHLLKINTRIKAFSNHY
jgi:hypothetical protein